MKNYEFNMGHAQKSQSAHILLCLPAIVSLSLYLMAAKSLI